MGASPLAASPVERRRGGAPHRRPGTAREGDRRRPMPRRSVDTDERSSHPRGQRRLQTIARLQGSS
eukprot:9148998-Alexandrium_andersonii.AAC.1